MRTAPMGPRGRITALRRLSRGAGRRLSWGVGDQAVSSLTNFAVGIFIARSLGAEQFGAFSLAYVTYTFVLNASRGLASDPLVVRFSGTDPRVWRRAVASCTGTATVVGLASGICALVAAMLLSGTAKAAFLALGLTLPGLMLQDSWRFAFFAIGHGKLAFLNDLVWALVQVPAFALLRATGHASVFWVVFAWGAAAAVAAAVGPFQAHVFPKLFETQAWLTQQRDLGARYLAENTASGGANQLRTYGIGLILGLAVVGYVRGAEMLMGPFLVLSMGISWAAVPEAVRFLRRSPRHLQRFCVSLGTGLAVMALAWGVTLLVLLPRGLGAALLGSIWRPAYPLVLPATVTVVASCFSVGASAGMRALGAARQSLRVQVLASAAFLVCNLVGALTGGAMGVMRGTALSTVIAALLWWWQLRASLREFQSGPRRAMTSAPDRQGSPGQGGERAVAPVSAEKLADQVTRPTHTTDVKSS
jgi:O-antigen/teichoic acid export membrane protein